MKSDQYFLKPVIIPAILSMIISGTAVASSLEELAAYFVNANTVSEPRIVECTLSSGTQTQCFQITVKPEPNTHTPGPWCPGHISDSADEGGIWLENGKVHDVDGAFIENMATFYADEKWQLFNPATGEIQVTDTYEKCAGAAKPNVEPEFQQHCVECQLDFVEDGKTNTFTIPLTPVILEQPVDTRSQGSGIAFDGIRLDASAPVAAILGNYTLAPFDDCGGHVNLAVGYHYHAATDCLEKTAVATDHGRAIGLAMDGHLIMARTMEDGSLPNNLDRCGGHQSVDIGYHYHAGEQGSNAILCCHVAEYGCVSSDPESTCDASATTRVGGGGERPDFAAAAQNLGVSKEALMKALGAPPPDFDKAADTLGVSVDDLNQAMGR